MDNVNFNNMSVLCVCKDWADEYCNIIHYNYYIL